MEGDTAAAADTPAPPRIWPALTVLFGVVLLALGIQIPALLIFALVQVALAGGDAGNTMQEVGALITSPLGLLVALLTAQSAYAIASYIPAALSPVPFARRLGFVRGRLPVVLYVFPVVASLFVSYLGELQWTLFFDEPSENLVTMAEAYADAPLGLGIALIVVGSLLPGLFEESLCRGYVQRRLLERWPPAIAVGLTSTVFAAMHLDPQHIVSVLPGAFWLGYVAWRADSTWPSIACHIFINAVLQSLLVFGDTDPTSTEPALGGAWLYLTAPAFVGAIVVLERAAQRPTLDVGAEASTPGRADSSD